MAASTRGISACAFGALDVGDDGAVRAEPQVRRPPVQPHRIAPAGDVIAPPGLFVLALDHDPAMHRDHALPAARAARHHQDAGVRMGRSGRQLARHGCGRNRPNAPGRRDRPARLPRSEPVRGIRQRKSSSMSCGVIGGGGEGQRSSCWSSIDEVRSKLWQASNPPHYKTLQMSNPVLVEAMRGAMVESRHSGAVAVADGAGRLVFAVGDVERPVYPRSAIKAMQALPLVESGAADRFGLGGEELALACASHNAEPGHVATAANMLSRAGPRCRARSSAARTGRSTSPRRRRWRDPAGRPARCITIAPASTVDFCARPA